jgi:hypothetical protein
MGPTAAPGRFPEGAKKKKDFLVLQNAHTQPAVQWIPWFFPGAEAAGA